MKQPGHPSFSRSSTQMLIAAFAQIGLSSLGCGGGGGSSSTEGNLSLAVVTEESGTAYRLSSATFEVVGAEDPLTLRTDDSPEAPVLQQTLAPGQYTVELIPGWVLEREATSGFEAVTGATLISDNPLDISLIRGQLTRVGFEFQAGDVAVDFRAAADEVDDTYD